MRWIMVMVLFVGICGAVLSGCSEEETSVNPLPEGPFVYNGVTYAGRGQTTDTNSPFNYCGADWPNIRITSPQVRGFEADGCFILNGGTDGTAGEQYVLIRVTKGSNRSYWYGRGRIFSKRIWLPFGSGEYVVDVIYMRLNEPVNLNYEGDYGNRSYSLPAVYEFRVNNTRDEDGTFYYPSDFIQSDDSRIADLAARLTAGCETVSNKIRVLHDYVCTNLEYDRDSLEPNCRKKQDAITCLYERVGVCEGYTSLYNALLRACAIRAKCIGGYAYGDPNKGHAWSLVDTGSDGWKYVDTTWDDGGGLKWSWFWKDTLADHTVETERPGRGRVPAVHNEKWKGYPAGVY